MYENFSIREPTVAMNEYFTSLLDAGFSRVEALYLLGYMVSPVGPCPPNPESEGK